MTTDPYEGLPAAIISRVEAMAASTCENDAAREHLVLGTCGCARGVLLPDCDLYNAAMVRTEITTSRNGGSR